MSNDLMEIKEELIREKYSAAESLLDGFDHTPRLAKPKGAAPAKEKSSGLGTRRRFRSTTPGLVTKSTARAEGVHIINRVQEADNDDILISPIQANVLHALRRALATSMVVADQFADHTGLSQLLKDNLEGGLAASRKSEFTELLAASSVISLHVFANMASFLLANAHTDASDVNVEVGEVEEVLTDNAHLALTGALWELDQDLAIFATSEDKLIPTITAFLEQLMEKVSLRASNMARLQAFTAVNYRVEEDARQNDYGL